MTQIPMDSIRIGVNHHASLCVAVAYMAFLDSPARVPGLMARMDDHAGRRISPLLGCTDWDFSGVEFWDGGMTSTFATWVACYMGGDPVLLCGMDCYQTGPVYCHGGTMAPHPCHDYPLENHLGAWRLALVHCERSEVIQAVSGPLVEVFGRYDA
jgi:predicted acylesterase/phospholipase RssA